MKTVVFADLHLEESRLEDQVTLLAGRYQEIERQSPDVIFLLGDFCGKTVPHRHTIRERVALVGIVSRLASIARVIAVRGNHDMKDDYCFLKHMENVTYVDERPLWVKTGEAMILCLPWADSSEFTGKEDYATAVMNRYKGAALKLQLDVVEKERAAGRAVLVVGHGAFKGTGPFELSPGEPVLDPAELLNTFAPDAAFFGHYHVHTEIYKNSWSVGSPYLFDVSDAPPRGYIAWDSSRGKCDFYAIQQSAWIKFEVAYEDIATQLACSSKDHLKVIVKGVPPDRGIAVRSEITRMYGDKVKSLRIDIEMNLTQRERAGAEEVSKATTLWDKVQAVVDTMTDKPKQKSVERMKELLSEAEEKVKGGLV